MEKENKKNNFNRLTLLVLVLFLGFFAGIIGEVFTRYYLSNFAFFRDLYFFNQDNNGQREIVIRDPRKVVVEQDLRIEQIKKDLKPALVGLYLKQQSTENLLDKVFLANDFLGQAIVLTSDGWLISTSQTLPQDQTNLLIVTDDKKIYEVEDFVEDEATDIVFLKINAQNLPVVKLADFNNLKNNQQVLLFNNYLQQIKLANILDKSYREINSKYDLVFSTEQLDKTILLNQSLTADYYQGAALIDMQGEIVGILSGDNQALNQAIPVHYIDPIISQVLKGEEINRPGLGVNYLNISQISGLNEEERQTAEAGALIWPDQAGLTFSKASPLQENLVAGDIIISLEDQIIDQDNDLLDIVLQYKIGQQISVKYLHDNAEQEISVILE